MSTASANVVARLEFNSVPHLITFLLSCREEERFGEQTEVFRTSFNQIYIPKSGQQRPLLTFRGHGDDVPALRRLTTACGVTLDRFRDFPADDFRVYTIASLLRAIGLREQTGPPDRPNHIILALWNANSRSASDVQKFLDELGLRSQDICAIDDSSGQAPSYLLRVHELRRLDAFNAWLQKLDERVEVYVPSKSRSPRFYVKKGFHYPLPGLEQFGGADASLVLIRPMPDSKTLVAQWLQFTQQQIEFFRRPHEIEGEVKLTQNPAPVELTVREGASQVPLEVAIIPSVRSGYNQIVRLDKRIDQQRRVLVDLEHERTRLAGRAHEVYFAYRFDQSRPDQLNPKLRACCNSGFLNWHGMTMPFANRPTRFLITC